MSDIDIKFRKVRFDQWPVWLLDERGHGHGDTVSLDFDMPVHLVDAGPLVKEDLGKMKVWVPCI